MVFCVNNLIRIILAHYGEFSQFFCLVTKVFLFLKLILKSVDLLKNRKNGKKLQDLVIERNFPCGLVFNKLKTLPLPDKF